MGAEKLVEDEKLKNTVLRLFDNFNKDGIIDEEEQKILEEIKDFKYISDGDNKLNLTTDPDTGDWKLIEEALEDIDYNNFKHYHNEGTIWSDLHRDGPMGDVQYIWYIVVPLICILMIFMYRS